MLPNIAALDTMVTDFVTDLWLVELLFRDQVAAGIGPPDSDRYRPTVAALVGALQAREVPDLETLANVVRWVLSMLRGHRQIRRLTRAEIAVYQAAIRLSNAVYGAQRSLALEIHP